MLWLIPAGLALGSLVLLGRRASAANAGPDIDRPARPDINETQHGKVDVRALAARVGAPEIWRDFFELTAYGESKRRTDVGLGILDGAPPWVDMNASTQEAAAAAKTYRSNLAWLEPCWPKSVYSFGSGGLFAMLPAAALAAFKSDPVHRCAHPWSIFDPAPTMIYAAWFARRLQGWSNWQGTVISMRIGWGNPSAMGNNASAKGRAKFEGHCAAVGLPASFLNEPLPRWKPAPAGELWASMGVDNGWLPEAKVA